MSEDHILIHIMLDDVAVKKMSRQAKNYYSLHNIPKGKFYICQHIWHHWFGLETKFNRTEIFTQNITFSILTLVFKRTCLILLIHLKKDMNNERGMHTIVQKMDLDVSSEEVLIVVVDTKQAKQWVTLWFIDWTYQLRNQWYYTTRRYECVYIDLQ